MIVFIILSNTPRDLCSLQGNRVKVPFLQLSAIKQPYCIYNTWQPKELDTHTYLNSCYYLCVLLPWDRRPRALLADYLNDKYCSLYMVTVSSFLKSCIYIYLSKSILPSFAFFLSSLCCTLSPLSRETRSRHVLGCLLISSFAGDVPRRGLMCCVRFSHKLC